MLKASLSINIFYIFFSGLSESMKSMAELILMALLDKQVRSNIFPGESLLPVNLVIFHNVYSLYIFTHECVCISSFYERVLTGCLKLCSLFYSKYVAEVVSCCNSFASY